MNTTTLELVEAARDALRWGLERAGGATAELGRLAFALNAHDAEREAAPAAGEWTRSEWDPIGFYDGETPAVHVHVPLPDGTRGRIVIGACQFGWNRPGWIGDTDHWRRQVRAEVEATADRIVAAMNACAGVPTGALEAGEVFSVRGNGAEWTRDQAAHVGEPGAATTYAERVRQLEAEGLTTSDAQAVADAEGLDET